MQYIITFTMCKTEFGELIFSDEFDLDGDPDSRKWARDVDPNPYGNELQYYNENPRNSYVQDKMLHIVAQKENLGLLAYTSAKLITANTQYFTYGRFDIRAKLPTGAGTWPAIWLVSEDDTYQEIDIMESWGSDPGKVYFTVHSSNNFTDENDHHGTNLQVNDLESSFHVYSVEWTPNHIYGFVDDVKYFSLFKSDQKEVLAF
ncbi:family_16 glycosylhydrolase [Hexamita inflata]|uniref:Family 16 glycosylhydrolase n=1 Tax=Hexamita inflata TaxID=28002 RepID=A0AA86Q2P3_9EUKA|nr:family 16 glycosylhydrolase [Hexamita inflata]